MEAHEAFNSLMKKNVERKIEERASDQDRLAHPVHMETWEEAPPAEAGRPTAEAVPEAMIEEPEA